MIHVVATIELKPGLRDAYLELLRANVPHVLAEKGCLTYYPTIDTDTDIAIHEKAGENVVTLIESWESVDALKKHFTEPHMLAYREKAKDMFQKISIRVLQPA